MINQKCFQKEWLKKIKTGKYPDVDIALLERTIYAFELLGLLSQIKKKFIFKGGTALILLLPELKRLSIDIDVLGNFEAKTYETVIIDSVFTRYEVDKRTTKNIPKQHVKFFYNSLLDKKEKYILLDLLDEQNPFTTLVNKTIHSELFEADQDVTVSIPSINDLLADKLTAFAPNTIGILYGTDKSMEIIKQLFDISILFDSLDDLEKISSTYTKIYSQQNAYRGNKFTIEEVLKNSITAASKICMLDLKG
ncbi:MAG: nucleotidyl transferase AbiEii/AbiGii toxin family protein, partial [Ignavibacteriaceae bacterium]|nr:nucleotidyl transferase AbiEii/AbiGii toxin family protein [Ignavibacteriaceae bacterium]